MGARTSSRQATRALWVEGKDDSAVTQSLCRAYELPEVFAVVPKSGVDEVLNTFYTALRGPGIERFGLLIDANGDAEARWRSIRDTLRQEGYANLPDGPAPEGTIIAAPPHRPRFGTWIMPDNASTGALEDFAATLVPADDRLWARAEAAVDAIPKEERKFSEVRRSKARMHTWLAWQESPGSPMGQAIGKGDLRADAPAAQRFVTWLRRLMLDDEERSVQG